MDSRHRNGVAPILAGMRLLAACFLAAVLVHNAAAQERSATLELETSFTSLVGSGSTSSSTRDDVTALDKGTANPTNTTVATLGIESQPVASSVTTSTQIAATDSLAPVNPRMESASDLTNRVESMLNSLDHSVSSGVDGSVHAYAMQDSGQSMSDFITEYTSMGSTQPVVSVTHSVVLENSSQSQTSSSLELTTSRESEHISSSVTADSEHLLSSVTAESKLVSSSITTESERVSSSVTTESEHISSSVTAEPDHTSPSVMAESEHISSSVTAESEHISSTMTAESEHISSIVTAESERVSSSLTLEIEPSRTSTSYLQATETKSTEEVSSSLLSPSEADVGSSTSQHFLETSPSEKTSALIMDSTVAVQLSSLVDATSVGPTLDSSLILESGASPNPITTSATNVDETSSVSPPSVESSVLESSQERSHLQVSSEAEALASVKSDLRTDSTPTQAILTSLLTDVSSRQDHLAALSSQTMSGLDTTAHSASTSGIPEQDTPTVSSQSSNFADIVITPTVTQELMSTSSVMTKSSSEGGEIVYSSSAFVETSESPGSVFQSVSSSSSYTRVFAESASHSITSFSENTVASATETVVTSSSGHLLITPTPVAKSVEEFSSTSVLSADSSITSDQLVASETLTSNGLESLLGDSTRTLEESSESVRLSLSSSPHTISASSWLSTETTGFVSLPAGPDTVTTLSTESLHLDSLSESATSNMLVLSETMAPVSSPLASSSPSQTVQLEDISRETTAFSSPEISTSEMPSHASDSVAPTQIPETSSASILVSPSDVSRSPIGSFPPSATLTEGSSLSGLVAQSSTSDVVTAFSVVLQPTLTITHSIESGLFETSAVVTHTADASMHTSDVTLTSEVNSESTHLIPTTSVTFTDFSSTAISHENSNSAAAPVTTSTAVDSMLTSHPVPTSSHEVSLPGSSSSLEVPSIYPSMIATTPLSEVFQSQFPDSSRLFATPMSASSIFNISSAPQVTLTDLSKSSLSLFATDTRVNFTNVSPTMGVPTVTDFNVSFLSDVLGVPLMTDMSHSSVMTSTVPTVNLSEMLTSADVVYSPVMTSMLPSANENVSSVFESSHTLTVPNMTSEVSSSVTSTSDVMYSSIASDFNDLASVVKPTMSFMPEVFNSSSDVVSEFSVVAMQTSTASDVSDFPMSMNYTSELSSMMMHTEMSANLTFTTPSMTLPADISSSSAPLLLPSTPIFTDSAVDITISPSFSSVTFDRNVSATPSFTTETNFTDFNVTSGTAELTSMPLILDLNTSSGAVSMVLTTDTLLSSSVSMLETYQTELTFVSSSLSENESSSEGIFPPLYRSTVYLSVTPLETSSANLSSSQVIEFSSSPSANESLSGGIFPSLYSSTVHLSMTPLETSSVNFSSSQVTERTTVANFSSTEMLSSDNSTAVVSLETLLPSSYATFPLTATIHIESMTDSLATSVLQTVSSEMSSSMSASHPAIHSSFVSELVSMETSMPLNSSETPVFEVSSFEHVSSPSMLPAITLTTELASSTGAFPTLTLLTSAMTTVSVSYNVPVESSYFVSASAYNISSEILTSSTVVISSNFTTVAMMTTAVVSQSMQLPETEDVSVSTTSMQSPQFSDLSPVTTILSFTTVAPEFSPNENAFSTPFMSPSSESPPTITVPSQWMTSEVSSTSQTPPTLTFEMSSAKIDMPSSFESALSSVTPPISSTVPVLSPSFTVSSVPEVTPLPSSLSFSPETTISIAESSSAGSTSVPFVSLPSGDLSFLTSVSTEVLASIESSLPPFPEVLTTSLETFSSSVVSGIATLPPVTSTVSALTNSTVPTISSELLLSYSTSVLETSRESVTSSVLLPVESSSTVTLESSFVETTSQAVVRSMTSVLASSEASVAALVSSEALETSVLERTVISVEVSIAVPGTSSVSTEQVTSVLESTSTSSGFVTSEVITAVTSPVPEATSTSIVASQTGVLPTSTVSTVLPSTSSSTEVMSSSLVPAPSETTTTTTTETTTPTTSPPATTVTSPQSTTTPDLNLLVVTVIRLRTGDDVNNQTFINQMEEGLARAYDLALQRKESATARRKRSAHFVGRLSHVLGVVRRRRAVSGNVEVKITDAKAQANNPSNAELQYTVAENGQTVPATQASETLNILQDQELALELGRVVVTMPQPSAQEAAPVQGEDKKLWIIAAVLGPLVFLVIIWIVVCLVVRHSQRKQDKNQAVMNEPHLLTVKHGPDGEGADVTEDSEASQTMPGQSNGLLKSSPRKMTYEVNPDPDASPDSKPSTLKKGKKSPKKKKELPVPNGGMEGDSMEETVEERPVPTPSKRKSGKKSSFRESEEMEMSPLDPGFYNSQMMQSSTVRSQLYSQPTFEEEDEEEFVEKVEEERKKNKQRQRQQKKQQAQKEPEPPVDSAQAAYERAQKEIDKVLGPREANAVPDVVVGNTEKKRSKRRSKRGQVNEGFTDDAGTTRQAPAPAEAQETLDEVRSRVHALLDDAFSLISNSYSSIGNKVAPATPEKRERPRSAEGEQVESTTQASRSQPRAGMPEVEEVRGPKPGEKLHTPVYVDRTYGDFDASGLITWSPYRASDESAHIVLPEAQPPSTKAPVQEKLHTTTFIESAATSLQDSYYATQPAQPFVIRTRQLPDRSEHTSQGHQNSHGDEKGRHGDHGRTVSNGAPATVNGLHSYGVSADAGTSYIPYPGLETYDSVPVDTTTAHFTASPVIPQESAFETLPIRRHATNSDAGGTEDASEPPVENHRPPTRNVGNRDERDMITDSLKPGASPKDLVDSIRQELKSMSGKIAAAETEETEPKMRADIKPRKKPRKSSYIDV